MRIRDTLLVLGTILCLLAPSAADAAAAAPLPLIPVGNHAAAYAAA